MNGSDVKLETKPELLMLGYLCVKELSTLPEKVEILDRFGLSGTEIETICGSAIQSVKDARQRLKKRTK
jgi:hypothetical protein